MNKELNLLQWITQFVYKNYPKIRNLSKELKSSEKCKGIVWKDVESDIQKLKDGFNLVVQTQQSTDEKGAFKSYALNFINTKKPFFDMTVSSFTDAKKSYNSLIASYSMSPGKISLIYFYFFINFYSFFFIQFIFIYFIFYLFIFYFIIFLFIFFLDSTPLVLFFTTVWEFVFKFDSMITSYIIKDKLREEQRFKEEKKKEKNMESVPKLQDKPEKKASFKISKLKDKEEKEEEDEISPKLRNTQDALEELGFTGGALSSLLGNSKGQGIRKIRNQN